jgi:hypothetical protein
MQVDSLHDDTMAGMTSFEAGNGALSVMSSNDAETSTQTALLEW